jgi:hypothetical protein
MSLGMLCCAVLCCCAVVLFLVCHETVVRLRLGCSGHGGLLAGLSGSAHVIFPHSPIPAREQFFLLCVPIIEMPASQSNVVLSSFLNNE